MNFKKYLPYAVLVVIILYFLFGRKSSGYAKRDYARARLETGTLYNAYYKRDFPGNDIIEVSNMTRGECAKTCEGTQGCIGFARINTSPLTETTSWLKSSWGDRVYDSGRNIYAIA
jgi:hypothetical protein